MDKKKIVIEEEETSYFIHRDGRLWNSKTNNFYKGSIRDGYRWFDLRWKGKKYAKSQHRLLAEAFLPNEQEKECIHHKDNNKLNNCLENLQWCTHSENSLQKNKQKQSAAKAFSFDEIENEEWVPLWDTVYLVSDYGRVRNSQTEKTLKGKITSSGYREYCLIVKGKKKSFRAHRLVWEAFHYEVPLIINHINGDKLDNRLQNLENVTQSENVQKTLHFPKTVQLDNEQNVVQTFSNNADAARAMGVRPQSIQQAIAKQSKSCGYYWKNIP